MTVAKHFEVQAIDGVECFHVILRYLMYLEMKLIYKRRGNSPFLDILLYLRIERNI